MGQIRGLQCSTSGRNTGHKGCAYMPKIVKGHILVPFGWSMAVAATDSDTTIAANLIAAIQAGFVLDAYASRFQFIGRYISFDDKSEADTMQAFNFGDKKKVNRGKYIHEYTYDNGGQDYHNAVLTFQGKHDLYKVLPVEDGVIRTVEVRNASGTLTAIQGVELSSLDVYDVKEATFPTEAEYRIAFTYAHASELNEKRFAIATGVNVFDTVAAVLVTDVELIPFTATSARVHPFMIKTVAGDVNLADTLGTALNSTTLVTAANENSGVAIAVTSVAVNTLTGKYVVTFTAGSGYVATEYAIVRLANVTAMHALGADYYSAEKTVRILMA